MSQVYERDQSGVTLKPEVFLNPFVRYSVVTHSLHRRIRTSPAGSSTQLSQHYYLD